MQVLTLGGLGYAAEYHVERYLRECFVPRIAPVSKVNTWASSSRFFAHQWQEMILNYIGEKALGLPKSY